MAVVHEKTKNASNMFTASWVGDVMHSCCATMNIELRDDSLGLLTFFKEPAISTRARSLLPFLGGCEKFASPWLSVHGHCSNKLYKIKSIPPVRHVVHTLRLRT